MESKKKKTPKSPPKYTKQKIIFLEGIYCCGKTTFIEHMKELSNLKFSYVEESYKEFKSLFYYSDNQKINYKKMLFEKKINMFTYLTHVINKQIEDLFYFEEKDLVIIESSPISTFNVYAKEFYDQEMLSIYEYKILKNMYENYCRLLDFFDVTFIFFDINTNTVYQRLLYKKRKNEYALFTTTTEIDNETTLSKYKNNYKEMEKYLKIHNFRTINVDINNKTPQELVEKITNKI